MDDYLSVYHHKTLDQISNSETIRLTALFAKDKGIENFRISQDGIYLEFNTYIYSSEQIEEILKMNGFSKTKKKKPGFFIRQIRNLAESNKRTFGDSNPNCCG